MKHQRGKVSKPRGLVQRREQADKEVKSWSPSQAKILRLCCCFFFSWRHATYLSLFTFPSWNHFHFYKYVRRGKERTAQLKVLAIICLNKNRRNTNTNTKVEKKRCDYRILSDYIKYQTSTRERSERSANRDIRGPRIIYIYTLYKRKVLQTLRNARRQKDMVFCLFPVPCSLSVCLSADILQTSMFPRKLRVGKLC